MPSIEIESLGDANPDGGFFETPFDKAVELASRELAPILQHHITVVKSRRIPDINYLTALIQTFATVAYKFHRTYDKADFTTWWKPMMLKESPMLRFPVTYINKLDRGVGGLRELREQGKVPDIIWKPWKLADQYEHGNVLDSMLNYGKTVTGVILLGVGAYFIIPKVIRELKK